MDLVRNWYAVLTRARAEKAALLEFQGKGMDSYLPLVEQTHVWKDRRKLVSMPLFPGYLFVNIDPTSRERTGVERSSSIVRILGSGDRIEPIPDLEIRSIRRLVESGTAFEPCAFLKAGEWVRVRRGSLRGVEGYFQRISKKGRLLLSVEMLARAVSVEIDASDVESSAPCFSRN